MITVREFRNMILECPLDWTIELRKWEHGNEDDFMKRNPYPMPNLVSVKIQEVNTRLTDRGNYICRYILEDDLDNDFVMTPTEMIDELINDLGDDDLIDFVLYTEDTPGHYDHIPLSISIGDKGYSDKVMIIDLEEKI